MIIADSNNGILAFQGTSAEIGDELMHIMDEFTRNIARTSSGKDLTSAMFHADPEIITNFTKLFVQSTH